MRPHTKRYFAQLISSLIILPHDLRRMHTYTHTPPSLSLSLSFSIVVSRLIIVRNDLGPLEKGLGSLPMKIVQFAAGFHLRIFSDLSLAAFAVTYLVSSFDVIQLALLLMVGAAKISIPNGCS